MRGQWKKFRGGSNPPLGTTKSKGLQLTSCNPSSFLATWLFDPKRLVESNVGLWFRSRCLRRSGGTAFWEKGANEASFWRNRTNTFTSAFFLPSFHQTKDSQQSRLDCPKLSAFPHLCLRNYAQFHSMFLSSCISNQVVGRARCDLRSCVTSFIVGRSALLYGGSAGAEWIARRTSRGRAKRVNCS